MGEMVCGSDLAVRRPVFKRTTWWRLLQTGVIPSRKVGGKRLVNLADVDAYLRGEQAGTPTSTPSEVTR